MQLHLTEEIFWLVLTIAMTALFWVPYILNRLWEQGTGTALWDPQGVTLARAEWANRMMRAHQNAVENLVIFAPLVIVLWVAGVSTDMTVSACVTYFVARAVHFVVFTLGIPVLRVAAFGIGFYAQMVLLISLLEVL